MYSSRREPRDAALPRHNEASPFSAVFTAYGGYCCDARSVQQREHEQRGCRERRHKRGNVAREEYLHGRYDALLGDEACHERYADAPVAEPCGLHYRSREPRDRGEDAFLGVVDECEVEVEALKEPHCDSRDKNDRKCALEEVLSLFPQELRGVAHAWHTVVGELHDEGHGLAAENGLSVYDGGENADDDAEEVQSRHDETASVRKECADEKRVDRKLCGAAHERREQYRHLAVAFTGERPRRHDSGHGTAEAYQKRDDAASRKSYFTQELIHNEGNSRDVAAVLEKRQEQEQRDDNGQEAEHAADAREDSVDDEAVYRVVDVCAREGGVRDVGEVVYALLEHPLQPRTDDVEGQPEYKPHNADKGGDSGVFARQHLVYAAAADMLLALLGLDYGLGAQPVDEAEPHIGDSGALVEPALLLHLADDVLKQRFLVLVERELRDYELVALRDLARREAYGKSCLFGVVLDEVGYAVEAAVNSAAVLGLLAKVLYHGRLAVVRDVNGVLDELLYARIFRGGYRYHRHTEHFFHIVEVDAAAVGGELVHHVDRHYHGDIELEQLHGEV